MRVIEGDCGLDKRLVRVIEGVVGRTRGWRELVKEIAVSVRGNWLSS